MGVAFSFERGLEEEEPWEKGKIRDAQRFFSSCSSDLQRSSVILLSVL